MMLISNVSATNTQDYYVLNPIEDDTLQIEIPTSSIYLRDLISKEKVQRIIKNIPHIPIIECEDKQLENEYKNLMNTESLENYIRIIKTTYLRNKEREQQKKKLRDKDSHYFNLAEKYLYNEFSVLLNKTFEETKNYVIESVMKLDK